jgi:hypothetical protein
MEYTTNYHGVNFNSETGIGANKKANVKLRVLMRPSIFLKLALQLKSPRSTMHYLEKSWRNVDFAPASLEILSWKKHNIIRHDGRHRMTFLMQKLGDNHFPVDILIKNSDEEENQLDTLFFSLNKGMLSQGGHYFTTGPLFKKI